MPKVTIRGRKLFYEDVGTGYPILFGHSYLWDSHMWKPQVEELSKHYRCIVPDLWSHGQSEDVPIGSQYTVAEIAEDYFELMKHLGLKKFAYIGISIGGMIGVELALSHPTAVTSLAIIGSYVGVEPEINRDKYFSMLDQADRNKKFTAELADIVTPLFFSPATTKNDPDLVRSFNIHLRSIPSNRIKGITTIGRGLFSRPDRLKALPKIKIPTMVIVGEDDAPRPPRESLQMAELLPDSSLIMLSQAGHICNLEQPEEITREIEKLMHTTVPEEFDSVKLVG